MNRRSFIAAWAHRPDRNTTDHPPGQPRTLSTGLEPYVPSAAQPWDAIRAGHLLRRTTFLPRWQDVSALLAKNPSDAVDTLLNNTNNPAPPSCANSATESLDGLDLTLRAQVIGMWERDAGTLRAWIATVLYNGGLSITEKMTFFWSGHFTSEFVTDDASYTLAPLLYRQNKLLRDNCLGNFRDLTMNVTLDGAMLAYLGGNLNIVGKPNENYARELMELFTLGLGNYSEGDIKEAARILTGWNVAMFNDKPAPNGIFNTYFLPTAHDINAKQFMGVSFPARDTLSNTEFLVRRDEVAKLIDTIFTKRTNESARFICGEIYRYFVYSNPAASDQLVINAMADLLVQNNFMIKPVMAALLKSAHFFDNANLGAQIKTPAEYEVGLTRQLGSAGGDISNNSSSLGQQFFDPPNVSGWTGWRDWITATTYPLRSAYAAKAITDMSDAQAMAFIQQFPNNDQVLSLTDSIGALLLPRKLSATRRTSLKNKLLGGSGVPDYEWAQILGNPSTAARNLRDMLTAITQLPDFQLC